MPSAIWNTHLMHEHTFTFTSEAGDGAEIAAYRWSGDRDPTAIVQIAHGMGEHAARYRRLAEALVDAGYIVYAADQRGHGRTAGSPDRHGDLGQSGWPGLVADIGTLGALARAEHPGIPLVVLGHSMGSFALQEYLLDHSADVDAAVLSGSTALDVVAPGIDPTKEVDLSLFNAPFAPARTEYDWLSRDDAEVDRYVADPECGFGIDAAATAGMLVRAAETGDPSGVRPDLPIHLISGAADPLAGGGGLVELVADRYRQAGVTDVTHVLYPEARHEVFNETNRDEVTADLLAWLARVTAT
jgi:alpha-beta hydrolase superfamily lysophospholipase